MEKMKFSKDILKIDPAKEAERICEFIRKQVFEEYKREGGVVGISGGIDSALACSLAVKALGKDKVLGLFLPEKETNPVSLPYGKKLAEQLGIRTEQIDLTPILEKFGIYEKREKVVKKLFPEYDEKKHKFNMGLPQNLLEQERFNFFILRLVDKARNVKTARLSKFDLLDLVAATDIKQRTRMTQLYYYAEKNNYLVVGTTNKSEYVQGFYVKYGDGGVDIEPLAHLYKMQVYEISRYLGVPQEIIDRVPSPDTFSAPVSDQEFYFCLPYDTLDMLLYAWENKIPFKEISKVLDLKEEQIKRVFKDFEQKQKATLHSGTLPANLL
jgi:NAD+ synthase